MNQILGNVCSEKTISKSKFNINKLKLLFYFSVIIFFICIMVYFFMKYDTFKKEKYAKNLANQFNITTLYVADSKNTNNNSNYVSSKLNYSPNSSQSFVIGLIKIDKINLFYPILSNSSPELLKIAPCYFYGSMPNQIGNLCIAGHNYVDNKLFSKIHLLNSGDSIDIYDLNGIKKTYAVYEKQEVEKTDTSCLNQNTNNSCEITLITCNNVRGTRVIIKAKENR